MKRLGLCFFPLLGIAMAACGDDGSVTGGAGGAGGDGGMGGTPTTTTTTTTTTTSTTTTTGTGTTVVPGCAGGQTFAFGEVITGTLDKEAQEDYYRFDGLKGQVLWIDIDAQDIDQVSFDPDYIDTIVTLVNEKDERVAQNDNPTEFSTADSRLYTILPEDGTYCVRVAECWTVKSNPAAQCLSPKEKIGTYYELRVFELIDDGPGDSNTADPEAGNDPASATDVDFVASQSGGYFSAYVWGYYENETDIDVFTFTLPPDIPVDPGARAHAVLRAVPSGDLASGSTTPTGEIYVVDPAVLDVPVARIDPSKTLELNAPLEVDKEYYLFVTRPAGTQEPNDFYFLSEFPGWGNPVEIDDAGNSDVATAEALDLADADSAFIEGDLLPITDLDHFAVDVPSGMTAVTAVCGSRTRGSGLRQMTISLHDQAGTLLAAGATDIETATQLAIVQDAPVGAATGVILKLQAPLQDPATSGAFYQCGVHFSAP
jgi:hypothetical protein